MPPAGAKNPKTQKSFSPVPERALQKKCILQRKASSQQAPSSVLPIVHDVLRTSGQPLDEATLSYLEPRFGHDFSKVRVHADSHAAESAQSMNAAAYTVGKDVVFNAGRYAPHTSTGKRLLAHEVAHVVQQGRGGSAPAESPTTESEASAVASSVVAGGQAIVSQGTAVGVAREEDDTPWWKQKLNPLYNKALEVLPPAAAEKLEEANELARDLVDEYDVTDEQLNEVVGQVATLVEPADSVLDVVQAAPEFVEQAKEKVKTEVAEKIDRTVGRVKGAASQVTDLADTVIWAGTEVRDAKNNLVEKTAEVTGVDPKMAETVANVGGLMMAPIMPTVLLVDALAKTGDAMKDAGIVDEAGKPSLTLPTQNFLDVVGDKALEVIGAPKSEDDSWFTERDIGELEGAIGIQVAGAMVGATEVKVGLALVGALGGIRGLVETMRANPNNFYTQPSFWSSLLGTALSIVGLKGGGVAKKVTTIALESGSLIQVVPHLWQLHNDYYDPALQADPELYRKTLKRDFNAVIGSVVDVVMTIVGKARAGKPISKSEGAQPKGGTGENAGSKIKTQHAEGTSEPVPAPRATKPDTTTLGGDVMTVSAPPITSGQGRPMLEASKFPRANLGRQSSEQVSRVPEISRPKARAKSPSHPSSPQVSASLSTKKSSSAGKKAQATVPEMEVARSKRPAVSEATKTLQANLAKQSPEHAGSVTELSRPKGRSPTIIGTIVRTGVRCPVDEEVQLVREKGSGNDGRIRSR